LGSISIQQRGPLARLPWRTTVTIILVPSLVVAFRTQDTLDRVMELLTYNGVMFVGVAPVLLVDFFVLRRQVIEPAHLFTRSRWGRYWYSGGINWVAMSVVLISTLLYFTLFNPVTLKTAHAFRLVGASVPIFVCAAAAYAVLDRVFRREVSARGPAVRRPVELSL
jgi:nucleobase:cation symporter-1, NCS1 family